MILLFNFNFTMFPSPASAGLINIFSTSYNLEFIIFCKMKYFPPTYILVNARIYCFEKKEECEDIDYRSEVVVKPKYLVAGEDVEGDRPPALSKYLVRTNCRRGRAAQLGRSPAIRLSQAINYLQMLENKHPRICTSS